MESSCTFCQKLLSAIFGSCLEFHHKAIPTIVWTPRVLVYAESSATYPFPAILAAMLNFCEKRTIPLIL